MMWRGAACQATNLAWIFSPKLASLTERGARIEELACILLFLLSMYYKSMVMAGRGKSENSK
jgi:hypothetical protein